MRCELEPYSHVGANGDPSGHSEINLLKTLSIACSIISHDDTAKAAAIVRFLGLGLTLIVAGVTLAAVHIQAIVGFACWIIHLVPALVVLAGAIVDATLTKKLRKDFGHIPPFDFAFAVCVLQFLLFFWSIWITIVLVLRRRGKFVEYLVY